MLLTLLLACAHEEPVPWCREVGAYDGAIGRLEALMARDHVPGAQFAIVEDGELVCTEALGQRSAEDATPIGRETRFSYGSISKMLASATALDLQEEGALDLAAPITDLVPDLELEPVDDPTRSNPDAITLRGALSHSAGFADASNFQTCPESPDLESLALVPKRLDTPPGLAFHYGNTGYHVAGLAIERADGRSYEEAVGNRLFEPIGMGRTTYDQDEITSDGDFASGFQGETLAPGAFGCVGWNPAGGAWGTAADLGRFAVELMDDDGVLTGEQRDELLTPVISTRQWPYSGYGLGMYEVAWNDDPALILHHHDGRWNGFLTELEIEPQSGSAVIVLLNSDAIGPSQWASETLAELLGWEPWTSTGSQFASDPDGWSEYEGTWIYDGSYSGTGAFHEMEIWRDRDWLFASKDGGPALQVTPQAAQAFYIPDDEQGLDGDPVVFWVTDDAPTEWLVSRNWSAFRR